MSRTNKKEKKSQKVVFDRDWGRGVSANGYRILHGLREMFWN